MRVAYVVSRFPHVSETFIVRELDGVVADGGVQIDLLSLFGVVNPTVHAAARPWIDRLQRGQLRRGSQRSRGGSRAARCGSPRASRWFVMTTGAGQRSPCARW